MAGRGLSERVEILEQRVGSLESLPAKVTALTNDVGALREEVSLLRAEGRVEFSAIRNQMGAIHEVAMTRSLELHDIAMSEMRTLHRDISAILARLDEALPSKRRRKPRAKR